MICRKGWQYQVTKGCLMDEFVDQL